jgi:hypothetical protein
MSLVKIILVLIVIGASLWTVNTYVPMTNTVKAVINTVLVGLLGFWLLQTFGVFDSFKGLRLR